MLISKKGFRLASLSDLEIELSSSTVQKLNGIFSLCLCQNHAFNAKVRNDKPLKIIKINLRLDMKRVFKHIDLNQPPFQSISRS